MQLLIETDILLDYLRHTGSESSVLRRALARASCYTTMLNAMECFSIAKTPKERDAVLNLLMAVRVLGFNSRYAEPFAELGKRGTPLEQREVMVLGMAAASKLTVLTERHYDRYTAVGAAPVVRTPEEVPIIP